MFCIVFVYARRAGKEYVRALPLLLVLNLNMCALTSHRRSFVCLQRVTVRRSGRRWFVYLCLRTFKPLLGV